MNFGFIGVACELGLAALGSAIGAGTAGQRPSGLEAQLHGQSARILPPVHLAGAR
jgi:F0F1-type ATP synthase membrane subunit c/vacuolar-type H+-ATPase subunit K